MNELFHKFLVFIFFLRRGKWVNVYLKKKTRCFIYFFPFVYLLIRFLCLCAFASRRRDAKERRRISSSCFVSPIVSPSSWIVSLSLYCTSESPRADSNIFIRFRMASLTYLPSPQLCKMKMNNKTHLNQEWTSVLNYSRKVVTVPLLNRIKHQCNHPQSTVGFPSWSCDLWTTIPNVVTLFFVLR